MQHVSTPAAKLGVIVVLYRSADVIGSCLASILDAYPEVSRVVLVDNASPDESAAVAQDLAHARRVAVVEYPAHANAAPPAGHTIEIIRSNENLGFAGGVNLGLEHLAQDPEMAYYWVLNPDCELTPGAAAAALTTANAAMEEGGFSILGTRLLYHDTRDIQSDGGIACKWTGRCRNLNQGRSTEDAKGHSEDDYDFISGASMIASRKFVEQKGPMVEDYFLYYEEVDWAARRGSLPLRRCLDSVVLHHGGTAIGSGVPGRSPSPMSNYFNFRNRIRFMRRFHPVAMPASYVFCLLKVLQALLRREWKSAFASFCGTFGMPPPAAVASAFRPEDQERAFRVPSDKDERHANSRWSRSPA
ncbi:MAG: glycosyltransferase family 2 protein [Pseudomonadota bacterium]